VGQAKHSLSLLLALPPGDLSDFLPEAAEIPVSPPQVAVGIPSISSAGGPIFGVPSFRQKPRAPESEWPKRTSIRPFPERDLGFLSTDVGKSSLSDMFRWGSRTIQAGPSFQWNIFNYGRITNNVRLQDARLQELLIAYQNTVLAAQREVEDNLIAF